MRSICDLLAVAAYAVSMKVDQVRNCTLIIRSQAEYSTATQCTVLRCILETPATGQRRGFSDMDDLLTALRAELLTLQNQLMPVKQEEAVQEEAEQQEVQRLVPPQV